MNFSTRTLFTTTLLCLFAPLSPAQSGTPAAFVPMANPDPRLAEIHAKSSHLEAPGQVAISPDGTLIAYTLRGREGSTLHLLPYPSADQSKEKIVSVAAATDCSNSSPVWSPDSQTLAFTSTCTSKQEKPGQPQIFLYSRATGEAKQLTHLTGIFQQAEFSPDGKSLAFLFVENATRSAGALAPMKPWSGVIGEDGVEIQRVYSVDIGTALGNFITPANLHVYEFDWAPNSHEIAFVGANPPGENNWWIAKLYTTTLRHQSNSSSLESYDLSSNALQVAFDPTTTQGPMHGLQIAVPRFSPDGKKIAFIGGLMSDQGSTGGDIWTVPATGGDPTDITPDIDGSPTYELWLNDHTIGFVEDYRGRTILPDYDVDKRALIPGSILDLGETSVSGGAIKDAVSISFTARLLAFVKSGHDTPPEVRVARTGFEKQITHFNDGAKPPARTESLEWTNEGFHIQGWLTYPANYDPAKKYPLIVQVHGGPSASAGARWGGSVWNDLGYFTFAPNPRGSFGEGEKFTAANKKDFGYGDLRDILAGMDAVEAKVSIDKNREGLTGGSYGGFMTMFGVTQTHRFHAAIAVAGISNWQSYYGENSIDQWMIPFFGASVYDDPADYAKSSAIDFIKNVTTPTLVVVGDRDGECPPPQSFEFWHALRSENVPTQLVIYPNEGHGIRQPDHARDLEAREVAWFAKYMPAQ
jgi:dipeptidyl aminopeptidase/acylaminoacyl peptidase